MIAVLGSANMDVVTHVSRIPRPGETVQAEGSQRFPGGKGANQAVAAARLGEDVIFCGKVGEDAFGEALLDALRTDGIDTSNVEKAPGTPTGMAEILVDATAENAIVYTPGANALVDAAYVDRVFDALRAAHVILIQLEIPLPAIAHLLRRLPSHRPTVLLDPAPVQDLSTLPLGRVDVLTPNATELAELTDEQDVAAAAHKLLDRGVRAVLCKMGTGGAYWFAGDAFHIPAYAVASVDTTAAGDAFNGALATAILSRPCRAAVAWACAAGAIATTALGAQPSLPYLNAVEAFVAERAS